jgi:hypothetical protein
MTLTPTLDKANADYFGGPDKPKKIIWNSGAGCRDITAIVSLMWMVNIFK